MIVMTTIAYLIWIATKVLDVAGHPVESIVLVLKQKQDSKFLAIQFRAWY
jgi:hypothetical protein